MADTFVALLRVHLFLPDSHSLKAKRAQLNRVKAHLRERVGASVSEVEGQDTWQRATLAVALTAGSESGAQSRVDDATRVIDRLFPDGTRVERRIVSWADMEPIG